ncbi:nicotinate (nicotinamide) nucleotide adenylyltransferase [Chloroherpeton thalassium ATCC 35110]|uniref:Probable nicotinate-nucleotide adenylyltransferase n=1 Tax=Chloroherpeton thalassium (strain ATCC 35110 / GB-78) TaxID=517418 RepID=NADD_CHLT3|nr:nicotinate (nicotinamide) nucleotide adenylyltransferase [Chloroherpeton thalassium]B3QYZ5.1 RecName: Full=Probable nicotinate-nucleotide adenylyltransferase; AltName: Full=Deamido-NAD(+) diphosphorylase; AltName: Full=Deamido-NAD(+) pyrophosphorylase; AltName: Full=Nicotinate mononucleotide adenylyltransferase; Short=NaMN adenylyltransferase [Chloroherpeton thalassium ATCC 35110]ACF13688.1 nicotinate (nicotinamide) nucleotide adenylyltransferase [Chloroherpeton thalassium ATCC 35110]
MKKIALFGGSFDPPHYGHFALCTLTRELFSPEKIILSISKNPLKGSANAPEAHQLAMAKLMAEELGKTGPVFEVSDWELRRAGFSYTIETLRHFHAIEPNAELLLCIGEDNYQIFEKWKAYQEILQLAHLVVFARSGTQGEQQSSRIIPPERYTWVQLDLPLSSSDLRREIAEGQDWQAKMPSSIAAHIAAHRLYQNEK